MREIKFRAFIKSLKWMVPVDLIDVVYEYVRVSIGAGTDAEYDFDEVELMQFTGLYDKNGREIYEGDVVESLTVPNGYVCRGVVIFEDGSFLMDVKNAPFAESGFKSGFDERIREYTVLGNIYENIELLGG